jgi:hypothetical protein
MRDYIAVSRPSSSPEGEAFASTGAERTWVRGYLRSAKTERSGEIGGRGPRSNEGLV